MIMAFKKRQRLKDSCYLFTRENYDSSALWFKSQAIHFFNITHFSFYRLCLSIIFNLYLDYDKECESIMSRGLDMLKN